MVLICEENTYGENGEGARKAERAIRLGCKEEDPKEGKRRECGMQIS